MPPEAMRALLEERITDGTLRIPPLPQAATQLQEMAEDAACLPTDVLRVVEREPALAVRVIRLANAPSMRPVTPIADLRSAVARVGTGGVRDMAFMLAMGGFMRAPWVMGPCVTQYRHAFVVAVGTQWACKRLGLDPDTGFLSGLLHDIGHLALLATLGDMGQGDAAFRDVQQYESVVLALHVDAGVEVAEKWRVPPPVLQAIACHHAPALAREHELNTLVVAGVNRAAHLEGTRDARLLQMVQVTELKRARLGPLEQDGLIRAMDLAGQDDLLNAMTV